MLVWSAGGDAEEEERRPGPHCSTVAELAEGADQPAGVNTSGKFTNTLPPLGLGKRQ